jgi:hypothetical protein
MIKKHAWGWGQGGEERGHGSSGRVPRTLWEALSSNPCTEKKKKVCGLDLDMGQQPVHSSWTHKEPNLLGPLRITFPLGFRWLPNGPQVTGLTQNLVVDNLRESLSAIHWSPMWLFSGQIALPYHLVQWDQTQRQGPNRHTVSNTGSQF